MWYGLRISPKAGSDFIRSVTELLRNLSSSQIKEWNVVMAGTLFAALPTLLIYVITGRYFIRGLLAGSVKG